MAPAQQLSLPFAERLVYSPQNFFLHQGVAPIHLELLALLRRPGFWSRWIEAPRRGGKSHFLIRLAEDFQRRNRYVRILSGPGWLAQAAGRETLLEGEIWLIDDADNDLLALGHGASGPFVEFVEALRVNGGGLVFTSSTPMAGLPCDDHVMSRLHAAAGSGISEPQEHEIPVLLGLLAKQHGLFFSQRQLIYLARRLPRRLDVMEDYVNTLTDLVFRSGKGVQLDLLSTALKTLGLASES